METLLAEPKAKKRRSGSAWGLVAAVLGRSELRNHFVNRFLPGHGPSNQDIPGGTAASRADRRAPGTGAVGAEVADVLLYLIQLAAALSIDPIAAAQAKLKLNAQKYPVDLARGSSKKHNEL